MKRRLKISLILLIQVLPFLLAAQDTVPVEPDEGMNIFLLVIATIFMGVMIGAAIIGAFLAAAVALLFFALVGFGLLSTSILIGLYQRSLSAGFKTLLVLSFGMACAIAGSAGLLLLHRFVPLPFSDTKLLLIGFTAGLAGGSILGIIAFKILKMLTYWFARKYLPQ